MKDKITQHDEFPGGIRRYLELVDKNWRVKEYSSSQPKLLRVPLDHKFTWGSLCKATGTSSFEVPYHHPQAVSFEEETYFFPGSIINCPSILTEDSLGKEFATEVFKNLENKATIEIFRFECDYQINQYIQLKLEFPFHPKRPDKKSEERLENFLKLAYEARLYFGDPLSGDFHSLNDYISLIANRASNRINNGVYR